MHQTPAAARGWAVVEKNPETGAETLVRAPAAEAAAGERTSCGSSAESPIEDVKKPAQAAEPAPSPAATVSASPPAGVIALSDSDAPGEKGRGKGRAAQFQAARCQARAAVAGATADALRTLQAQRCALKAAVQAAKGKVQAERAEVRAAGERCMTARQQGAPAEQLESLRAARMAAIERVEEAVVALKAAKKEKKAAKKSAKGARKAAAKAAAAAAVGTTESPTSGSSSSSSSSSSDSDGEGKERRGMHRGMHRGMGVEMGHGGHGHGWWKRNGPGQETTVTGGAEFELSGLCGGGVKVAVPVGKEVVVRPFGPGRWVVVDRAIAPRPPCFGAQPAAGATLAAPAKAHFA